MELSLSQIKSLTRGAVSVTETEEGIRFDRYTAQQLQAFEAHARCFFKRGEFTCGVRVDLYTDSPTLSVGIGTPGQYEVLVDGLTAHFQVFEEPGSFSLDLGAGKKRITVILPSRSRGSIRYISLADGAQVEPAQYARRIAFYGDSITQGFDSGKDSDSYAWLTTRFFDADSIILGVGGAIFYPDTVLPNGYDVDTVIVALGTNDFEGELTLEQVRQCCSAYLDRICDLYPGKQMFYITPLWRADGERSLLAGTMADIRAMVAEEATKRNMTVIDGYDLVPHRTEYFADGFLHPNDMGFAQYAHNLTKRLSRYL